MKVQSLSLDQNCYEGASTISLASGHAKPTEKHYTESLEVIVPARCEMGYELHSSPIFLSDFAE